jgi:hypothetical protein
LILTSTHELAIEIGGMPIVVRTDSDEFADLLQGRYGSFVHFGLEPVFELDVELIPSVTIYDDEDLTVRVDGGRWIMDRGDFHAECDPIRRRGWVRQSLNPYSIDGVLRILHSLLLAAQGGFLVHAASAVRNGRAFLFSGVSGAGKTTISRLAPPDVLVLTDEISYVRKIASGYDGCGTPFAGELARIGANVSAPLAALYFLVQGAENRIQPVAPADAARRLLRNILFFAYDESLVQMVFQSALDFANTVPVHNLVFTPDNRVWELIQ